MDDLNYFKHRAAKLFANLELVMNTLNKDFCRPGFRWEMDEVEGLPREVKLPEMTWEEFEEPNDPIYTQEEQELILRR